MSATWKAIDDQIAGSIPVLFPLGLAVVTAALAFIVAYLKKAAEALVSSAKTSGEAHLQNTLQVASSNAAGLVAAEAKDNFTKVNVSPGSHDMTKAIAYVQSAAPEAISKFRLAPAAIEEKVIAKLGILSAKGDTRDGGVP